MKKAAIGGVVLVVAVVGLTIVGRSLKTAGPVASERPNTDLADLSANRGNLSADSMHVPRVRERVPPTRVVLNFASGRMIISARVPRPLLDESGRGYIWAYFTHPDFDDSSWSDAPIAVRATSESDSVEVTGIREHFGWWDNSAVPRIGYRAIVFAGSDSARLYLRATFRDKAAPNFAVSGK